MNNMHTLTAKMARHGESVVEQLDKWSVERPSARCFFYGEKDLLLTYSEFSAQTDSVAGFLSSQGFARGRRVSTLTRNPLHAALLMFGVWKAGAVYAPINFAFSGRLLSYQINDTRPCAVLVDASGLQEIAAVWDTLTEKPALILSHDAVEAQTPRPSGAICHQLADTTVGYTRPDVRTLPSDPANIVYTSGTTGPAKGVVQPHRWMAQYTYNARLIMTQQDVVYNDLPLYHVGGAIFNVVRAIWVGCEVACWDRFSPTQFWDRIDQVGATTAVLLDAMIPWLMNAPAGEKDRTNSLNKVHMQPLPLNHHAVAQRFGIDVITCGFGQTESGNGLVALINECEPGEGTPASLFKGHDSATLNRLFAENGLACVTPEQASVKGFMGRPSPFFEVAILDESDELCAPGEVGQLALRPLVQNTIFLEYFGKPEATAAALRNAWFHTGDAATELEDGTFLFVDRLGDRIRVRGENLSSFHIEDLLNQHADVSMTAAFAVPAQEGDEDDIVAYIVLKEGRTCDEVSMHSWIAENLPKFMRPRHVRFIAELPRTATNKIEKYKLRTQFSAAV